MHDAELDAVLSLLASLPKPTNVTEMRERLAGIEAMFPLQPDVTKTPLDLDGLACEWTATPQSGAGRAILYLHGGAYVAGSIGSHRHLAAELGRQSGASVFAIDYRLAPEHQFPAALDDALKAYRHLLESGFAPGSIAIAGDSAGGGLTITTLLALADTGLPQPACAFVISPWLDLDCNGTNAIAKAAVDPIVDRQELLECAAAYRGEGSVNVSGISPLLADFSGIAPIMIQVGSSEVLFDDSIALAATAGSAGVPVKLEVWSGMIHVWQFFHQNLTAGRAAIAEAGRFISSHFN